MKKKIKAFLISTVFLLIAVPTVLSVTRTISSSQDNMETFIRNSNGMYWEANAGNIQAAIDDLVSTNGGWVKIPPGSYDLSSTGPIRTYNLSVIIEGATKGTSWVPDNEYVTRLNCGYNWTSSIEDGRYAIEIGGNETEFTEVTENVIIRDLLIEGNYNNDNQWQGGILMFNCHHCRIENVMVNSFASDGTSGDDTTPDVGINITSDGSIGSYYNAISNCKLRRNTVGVFIGYNSNANLVDGGTQISNGLNKDGKYPIGIYIVDGGTNWFTEIDIEDFSDSDGNSSGVYMENTPARPYSGANKFLGTRFEGNNRDVYIDSTNGGKNKFIGISSSTYSEYSIYDGASWKSTFTGCNFYNTTGDYSWSLDSIQKSTHEPELTHDGLLAYADGTSWNPGSGEGLYIYYNSQWNYLG